MTHINKRILLILPTSTYRASAFLTAAGKLDIEAVVGSDHRQALSNVATGTTLALNFHRPDLAVAKIVEFAATRPFDAVVGVDEETVVLAAMAGEALCLPHNPFSAVQATRDKHLMRQRLVQAGVISPQVWLFSIDDAPREISQTVHFPCVLKPTFLSASRGVLRANDVTEFVAAFQEISDLMSDPQVARKGGQSARQILVEDYIPGGEVALEGLLIDGELKELALFDKPDPLEGPLFIETIYLTPSRLPQELQQEIVSTTHRAARALGLERGPIHAELRFNESGVWPVEIAARSIGGLCSRVLRFEGGVSLEELILRYSIGMDISNLQREPQAAGVMMIPVPRPGILREVKGVENARQISGIEDVIISIPLDQGVEPLPKGSRYLGFIFARGDSPESVESAIREACSRLDILIEDTSY